MWYATVCFLLFWEIGKHKFFAWLLVQTKLLTADKLTKRNWPCDEQGCLCDQESESAAHLCLHCPFAREVWALVAIWTDNLITMPEQDVGVEDWWYSQLRGLPKEVRRLKAALLMYTAWNIWKERNRRTFEGRSVLPPQVLRFIKDEMALRVKATGRDVHLVFYD